jgi:hypothetical protein
LINIPFNLDESAFCYTGYNYDKDIIYMAATLYVPRGRTAIYSNVQGWKKFMNKMETDTKYNLTYMVDGEVYKNYEIQATEVITPEPDPYREGYDFSGWSTIPSVMPAHDVTVTGTFTINSYDLTYMIDEEVYKVVAYNYGTAITPEPQPEGDYATFEWMDIPATMPAHDVVVHASYTTGIRAMILSKPQDVQIYSPNGKKLNKLQKGLNIVKMRDGTIRKIVIK